ncbi:MAG: ABC transporter ATP-binding protein [Bacteroidales bacterium]|jgi:lipoprotein-releasing system ATP-binding protein|nr:ABC transporter ATP-binding protein [Bacteroidales bacterium]MBR3434545.1 ABC transporter ATP-binding protein [Bacteroidales bacterium]
MIKVEHLNKSYGTLQVLRDINLCISQGEVVSIVGASGAGKTTLLQLLGTLDKPDSGRILYDDVDVTGMDERALSQFRNKNVGFVFQFHNLLPEFTALENVCLPALIGGRSMSEATEEAMQLLNFLKVADRAGHKPAQLSGGEQQRFAVARALINHPAVVLADEPSGNLDTQHAAELHDLFFQLRDQYRQTFVIVTHNTTLAQKSDRQIVLKDGQICNEQ